MAIKIEFKYSREIEYILREWIEEVLTQNPSPSSSTPSLLEPIASPGSTRGERRMSLPPFLQALKSGVLLCRFGFSLPSPNFGANKPPKTDERGETRKHLAHQSEGFQSSIPSDGIFFPSLEIFRRLHSPSNFLPPPLSPNKQINPVLGEYWALLEGLQGFG